MFKKKIISLLSVAFVALFAVSTLQVSCLATPDVPPRSRTPLF